MRPTATKPEVRLEVLELEGHLKFIKPRVEIQWQVPVVVDKSKCMNDKYLTFTILGNYWLTNNVISEEISTTNAVRTDRNSSHKAAIPMDRQTHGHGNWCSCHLEVGFI
jgi:hypothetical protein